VFFIMKILADRLKELRRLLGYSQREMAGFLEINAQSWQGYEAGSSVPGGKSLEALAQKGFNINWLLTGVGSIYQEDNSSPDGFDKMVQLVSLLVGCLDYADRFLLLRIIQYIETYSSEKNLSLSPIKIGMISKNVFNSLKTSGVSSDDVDAINKSVVELIDLLKLV